MAEKFNYAGLDGITHRVSYEHRVSQNSLLLDAAEYTFTDRELQDVLGFVELMNNTTSANDSASQRRFSTPAEQSGRSRELLVGVAGGAERRRATTGSEKDCVGCAEAGCRVVDADSWD